MQDRIPSAGGMALAWLRCGSRSPSRAADIAVRVTVLKAVNSRGLLGNRTKVLQGAASNIGRAPWGCD